MNTDNLQHLATVAWALRWWIAGLAIAMAAAVPIARHMERDRRLIADLAAERDKTTTLEHAAGALAVTVAHSDPHPQWVDDLIVPQFYDGRS